MCFSIVYLRQTNNRKNFKTFDANRVYIEIRSKWNAHPSCAAHARATTTRVVEQYDIYIYNQPELKSFWRIVYNGSGGKLSCQDLMNSRYWHTRDRIISMEKLNILSFKKQRRGRSRLGKGKASWCRATCRQLGSVTTPPSRRVTATNHAIRNCRYQLHDFM